MSKKTIALFSGAFLLTAVIGIGANSARAATSGCQRAPLDTYASQMSSGYRSIDKPDISSYVDCLNLFNMLEIALSGLAIIPGTASTILGSLTSNLGGFLCGQAGNIINLNTVLQNIQSMNPAQPSAPSSNYNGAPNANRIQDIVNRLKNLPGSADTFDNNDSGVYSGGVGGGYDPLGSTSGGSSASGGNGNGGGWSPLGSGGN